MLKILVGLKIMLKYSIIIRLVTKYKRYLILSVINGAWPSGKAAAFGAAIRRFESCRPSQRKSLELVSGVFRWCAEGFKG